MKNVKPFDLLIIVILMIISISYGFIGNKKGYKKIILIVENRKKELRSGHYKYNLLKDYGKNIIIEIAGKKARIIQSDCLNKICIKEGWIEKCGETAVCLPNKTAIQIKCDENNIDAISK